MATKEDVPTIVGMSRAYYDAMAPVWPYDRDGISNLISALIASPDGFVAVGRGFVAGAKAQHPASPSWTVASEWMWWSEGDGAALFLAFRRWARDADEIRYSCSPEQIRVAEFFGRRGPATEIIYSEV